MQKNQSNVFKDYYFDPVSSEKMVAQFLDRGRKKRYISATLSVASSNDAIVRDP